MSVSSFQRMRNMAAARQSAELALPERPGMNTAEAMREELKANMPDGSPQNVTEIALQDQRERGNNPESTVTMRGGQIVERRVPDENPEQYSAAAGYAPPTSVSPGTVDSVGPVTPAVDRRPGDAPTDEDPDKYSAARGHAPPTSVPAGESSLSSDTRAAVTGEPETFPKPTQEDLDRLSVMRRDDMAKEAATFGVEVKAGMTKEKIYQAVADLVEQG